MASEFLGTPGKVVAWIVYLFIAYLSLAAYILGGGDIFKTIINNLTNIDLPNWLLYAFFIALFGIVIEISAKAVGKINSLLFTGLVISYIFIVLIGLRGIDVHNLETANFEKAYFIIPLFLTSFSFQMIIPSLANYLNRDRFYLRTAIILGTSLSFIIYFLWNGIVFGHLPAGAAQNLAQAYADGQLPISSFSGSEKTYFYFAIHIFAFFALVTSFIGISWGLFDFLADGLNVIKAGKNRLGLWLLVMTPPYIFSLSYPRGFVGALETTGGFGDTILNGLIPILMFWIGCYSLKKSSKSILLKNRFFLSALITFALMVIALEAVNQFKLL